MQILPLHTPLLRAGSDLAAALLAPGIIRPGDIVAVSSKAVATCEGAGYALSSLDISEEAHDAAAKTGRTAAFCEAVLRETAALNGRVVGACPGALLTEVTPAGLRTGSLLVPNAGLDTSNVPPDRAIGWPADSAASASALRAALGAAVIITDSCCVPRRLGVLAFALAVSGLPPHRNEIGQKDLYGAELRITVEATADQLAVAANAVMGNARQSCPAAVIRDHGIPLTDDGGWVPAMPAEKDLFRELFRPDLA